MESYQQPTKHHMGRRIQRNDYSQPGMYHITLQVAEGMGHPFGQVVGNASQPDGSPQGPRVELSAVGRMVEKELIGSICRYYPMVEVQTHMVMPEHIHFIVEVHEPIVSRRGRTAHLGQVIAGFKKGCNRRFWELTGQGPTQLKNWRGEPASADTSTSQKEGPASADTSTSQKGEPTSADMNGGLRPAVCPPGIDDTSTTDTTATTPACPPSRGNTGRPPLFAEGYVDVMPLHAGQLQQQREYIKGNPCSRLLRSTRRDLLQPRRDGIDTALTINALMGYLTRECAPSQLTEEIKRIIASRLLTNEAGHIVCHSYGDRHLLKKPLRPVVCHRRDQPLRKTQHDRCLQAANEGCVLVSARIAKLVTPWQYKYRPADEHISVAECKTMNCVVQALCRQRDSWWKELIDNY